MDPHGKVVEEGAKEKGFFRQFGAKPKAQATKAPANDLDDSATIEGEGLIGKVRMSDLEFLSRVALCHNITSPVPELLHDILPCTFINWLKVVFPQSFLFHTVGLIFLNTEKMIGRE